MKNLIVTIFILLPFFSFSQKVNENLIGDWVSLETRYILSFTNSTIGFLDWGEFQECYTKSDTIFFESPDIIKKDYSYLDSIERKPVVKRTVVTGIEVLGGYKINGDSLTINVINDNLFFDLKLHKFKKLEAKNSIDFDSIFIESSWCMGLSPSMEIKILSNRDFYFKGKMYTEKLGNYKGRLSDDLHRLVSDKIRQLDFNSYDSAYFAGHTDGQTRNLILYHNGNRERIQIYGHEAEPLELNVFFHYLTELYKNINLKELNFELEFEEMERLYPKPPPPLSKEMLDLIEDFDEE
ncbi:DUF6438 domain-containing protein [Marinifilum caeruleilacunae]|uniref:DUF6438 domain-containing protein n=1 Tax=Marinifilum caeruleilacunae TaxID=2499076 RepID=A0ABX1X135_9BACT|nr:DUF6438 domain-containing protein [Marinifilum caeruleilacunae]NOU61997.1 hypothetical protein [Marinifilum caeruleilacunae]